MISTATNKVTARWSLPGGPSQITFAPSGQRVYVATSAGVAVYSTATQRRVAFVLTPVARSLIFDHNGFFAERAPHGPWRCADRSHPRLRGVQAPQLSDQ